MCGDFIGVALQPHRRWDSTGACLVKYIEDMERSEFNWGAGKGSFSFKYEYRRDVLIFHHFPFLLS